MNRSRTALLGVLFALLALVGGAHADAATCDKDCCLLNCSTDYYQCLQGCARLGGECRIICLDSFTSCNQLCEE
jgi:hypothetical protein